MSSLRCILYVSTAAWALSEVEIEVILETSRERNQHADVTGILLHRDGTFMQLIEGPQASLDRIFAIIRRDARHTGIIEILNEPATARELPIWSMAYRTRNFQAFVDPELFDSLLRPMAPSGQSALSPAKLLLNRFWNEWQNRGGLSTSRS
jgi:hypothetical protein